MFPGSNLKAGADDVTCNQSEHVNHRLVIVGGIGITAFLPAIQDWDRQGLSYEVHYAARSMGEAAFVDMLPTSRTAIYP